ncbi:OmpA family protein [Congregibacter brevis]|uniref:OmpA family protein n=1 Tax=Congregibacter brevis TaxID=3081201 RepID=A0ABZ0II78_9GAMM|nr:OmpA family protein [Congregibacter sp. IMCC45268]
MKLLTRLFVLLSAAVLAACSSVDVRHYEACIVGSSAVGGVVGATAGGAGAVGGVAVGAGVGAVICDYEEPAPMAAAAAAPTDSDGDGVMDDKDRCANTPAGAEVDMNGCALDSDGDGVADYKDQCANTPAGVKVDTTGCPVKDEVVLTVDRLNFDFDSATLDAQSRAALDSAVAVIKSHSSVKMDVVGYTDTSGPEEYNQGLSERRAQAAVDYLVSQGIDADQLRATGRGEANPIASNDSRDGRERNRRVELVVR